MEHPSTTKRIRLIQVRISFCQVNGDKCVGSFFALLFWHILTLAFAVKPIFIPALQCRLECKAGYVAQRKPLITCVNGEYE